MKPCNRIYLSFFWIILGGVLVGLSFAGKVDQYWNGMGSALLVVGVLQVLRFHRLRKNEAYREKVETELSDERNQFIRSKAWAWSGYLLILFTAISSIILKIMDQELLSMAAGFVVCLTLILFWTCYFVLRKKY
jgi:membrane protease YdiL (CAAX protease family)